MRIAKGWAAWIIAGLAVVAVVSGLGLVGGPAHARKQNRDREREQDLMTLANLADCLAAAQGVLPKALAATDDCDWQLRHADPFTGAPYRYEVTGPRSYRLCASFELPRPRLGERWGRNEQGCISREFIPSPAAAATIPYRP